ncbi:Predicted phosphoribosyltransferase [Maribacter orientalis]|uniref:Predicted phosphoribosyltransferase n=1 Tax=Maribacter orientalis TaxID=228957 RepID=A0A1H7RRX9_9FLAO|nr:phosphoribosyltransferase family protein [Maribacter orientalis]SEL62973.1 Predicted phosphoribosyltransferase [Maribacter orientalis]
MFRDRIDAGRQLSEKLMKFKEEDVVVLAIPRGGLPLGAIVAKTLEAPLDVALTKKIGHPSNKEFAIGAVSLDDIVLTNTMGVTQGYITEETKHIREKLLKRHDEYYKKRLPQNVKNKTVIIVDDGIATGNTLLATIELVSKQRPKKIIVAIPVAPNSAIKKLENTQKIDEVICLQVPYSFQAVGQFYEDFYQVSDQEAIQILEEANTSVKTNL